MFRIISNIRKQLSIKQTFQNSHCHTKPNIVSYFRMFGISKEYNCWTKFTPTLLWNKPYSFQRQTNYWFRPNDRTLQKHQSTKFRNMYAPSYSRDILFLHTFFFHSHRRDILSRFNYQPIYIIPKKCVLQSHIIPTQKMRLVIGINSQGIYLWMSISWQSMLCRKQIYCEFKSALKMQRAI